MSIYENRHNMTSSKGIVFNDSQNVGLLFISLADNTAHYQLNDPNHYLSIDFDLALQLFEKSVSEIIAFLVSLSSVSPAGSIEAEETLNLSTLNTHIFSKHFK